MLSQGQRSCSKNSLGSLAKPAMNITDSKSVYNPPYSKQHNSFISRQKMKKAKQVENSVTTMQRSSGAYDSNHRLSLTLIIEPQSQSVRDHDLDPGRTGVQRRSVLSVYFQFLLHLSSMVINHRTPYNNASQGQGMSHMHLMTFVQSGRYSLPTKQTYKTMNEHCSEN